jgi:hypothetical protein
MEDINKDSAKLTFHSIQDRIGARTRFVSLVDNVEVAGATSPSDLLVDIPLPNWAIKIRSLQSRTLLIQA